MSFLPDLAGLFANAPSDVDDSDASPGPDFPRSDPAPDAPDTREPPDTMSRETEMKVAALEGTVSGLKDTVQGASADVTELRDAVRTNREETDNRFNQVDNKIQSVLDAITALTGRLPQAAAAPPAPPAPGQGQGQAQPGQALTQQPPPQVQAQVNRARPPSFQPACLPALSIESSREAVDDWINAFLCETDRCNLELGALAKTLRAIIPVELKKEIRRLTGFDLADPTDASYRWAAADYFKALRETFDKLSNRICAGWKLLYRPQRQGESAAKYAAALNVLASYTEYAECEALRRDIFIHGLQRQSVREAVMKCCVPAELEYPSLAKAISIATANEEAEDTGSSRANSVMSEACADPDFDANAVSAYRKSKQFNPKNNQGKAPFCNYCKSKGHLKDQCPKKKKRETAAAATTTAQAQMVFQDSDDSDVGSYSISVGHVYASVNNVSASASGRDAKKSPLVCDLRHVRVGLRLPGGRAESEVVALADTGSAVNILTPASFKSFQRTDFTDTSPIDVPLQPASIKIRAANTHALNVKGQFDCSVVFRGKAYPVTFLVAPASTDMLSRELVERIGLYSFSPEAKSFSDRTGQRLLASTVSAQETENLTTPDPTPVRPKPRGDQKQLFDVNRSGSSLVSSLFPSRASLPAETLSVIDAARARLAAAGLDPSAATPDDILELYKGVFDDKSKPLTTMSTTPMVIDLVDDATPFAVSGPRPIPYAIESKVKEALDEMEHRGVVRRVTLAFSHAFCKEEGRIGPDRRRHG